MTDGQHTSETDGLEAIRARHAEVEENGWIGPMPSRPVLDVSYTRDERVFIARAVSAHEDRAELLRRISTPIPLTPSDEMVEAALQVFDTGVGDPNDYRRRMKSALTAALNLMGGDK